MTFRQSTKEKRRPGFRKLRAVNRKRDNHLLAIFGNSPDDAIPRLFSLLWSVINAWALTQNAKLDILKDT
jgi:hypothetical protein